MFVMCKMTNLDNQKPYYFISTNVNNTFEQIIRTLNNGNHRKHRLQHAWKHHKFSFEVLEICDKNTIRFYVTIPSYNKSGYHHSDQTRAKISNSLGGKKHYHHSNAVKTKIKNAVLHSYI